jgi:hypothetical protein
VIEEIIDPRENGRAVADIVVGGEIDEIIIRRVEALDRKAPVAIYLRAT